jgi:hypothetical protein
MKLQASLATPCHATGCFSTRVHQSFIVPSQTALPKRVAEGLKREMAFRGKYDWFEVSQLSVSSWGHEQVIVGGNEGCVL